MSRIRKVTTKMKYHFHIIHSLVQTIIVEKRGSKKVVSLLFDVTTDELVLPIQTRRSYCPLLTLLTCYPSFIPSIDYPLLRHDVYTLMTEKFSKTVLQTEGANESYPKGDDKKSNSTATSFIHLCIQLLLTCFC